MTTDNDSLATSISAHVLGILDINTRLSALEEDYNQTSARLKDLSNHKAELIKELKEARKLLDFCLETNSDPVQARLSHTTEQMKDILALKKSGGSNLKQMLTETFPDTYRSGLVPNGHFR